MCLLDPEFDFSDMQPNTPTTHSDQPVPNQSPLSPLPLRLLGSQDSQSGLNEDKNTSEIPQQTTKQKQERSRSKTKSQQVEDNDGGPRRSRRERIDSLKVKENKANK